MDREELARESQRVLALLEQKDQEDEACRRSWERLLAPSIPPPSRLPKLDEPFTLLVPKREPAARARDVRYKLADAWVLLTECREAVHDWQRRAQVDAGMRGLEAVIRHAAMLVDDAIVQVEPPTDRKSTRPTRRP
jgi:hypothetical protein